MTFKEKLKQVNPEVYRKNLGHDGEIRRCPSSYNLEEDEKPRGYCRTTPCKQCWGREFPEKETKEEEKQTIKDNGERRKFESGAVRDMAEGKGRFDLLPLDVLGTANQDNRLTNLAYYQKTNDPTYLYAAMSAINYRMDYALIERIAKHFENGAKKYNENNWRKGLPCKCYIDSAVRHYFKWILSEIDEDHESAYYWNIMCCAWTHENIPEMQSYKREVD